MAIAATEQSWLRKNSRKLPVIMVRKRIFTISKVGGEKLFLNQRLLKILEE